MTLSVVVCTYEAPEALDAVLRALAEQSDDGFDVVVADDGSGPPTEAVVDGWSASFGDRLAYVWQPDEGFRVASALNRGVLASRADFFVFLGGDCVPREDFVRAVRAAARPGWFIATNRVLLPRTVSERVLRERTPLHRWSTGRVLLATRGGGEARALLTARDRRRVGSAALPDFEPHGRAYCCIGVHASDFADVNGYDTRFVGWGDEDVDLAVRLGRLGLRCGHAGPDVVPLHLWHESRATADRPNWDLMQETVGSDRIEAVRGLRELRAELGMSRLDTPAMAAKVGVPDRPARGGSDLVWGDDVTQAWNGPISDREAVLELTIPRQAARGVNLVGFLQGGLGLGEVARMLGRALESSEIPFAAISYPRAPSGQKHQLEVEPSRVAPYDTNLICLNADYLHAFLADVGVDFFAGRRSIGLWFWESSVFRPEDLAGLRFLDEVWVASEYVKRAVAASDVPVHVVPLPVEAPLSTVRTRAELGLPDGFLFLFVFDWLSAQRKNPGAVVEAFTRAFEPGEGPVLVMKSINGHERKPRLLAELEDAVAARPDIHVVDRFVSAEERDAILGSCDCFVSLHRSEGFGLPLAEAMAHGKPVIATAYSGNLEFMDAENSRLVPYRMVPVPEDWWAHAPGAEWAEPDVDSAARLMRRVYEDPGAARELGERGRASILSAMSLERAAEFIRRRLEGGPARSTAEDARPAILGASAHVSRGVGAGLADARESGRVRRMLLRALWPYLEEQHRYNTSVVDALAALKRSCDELERRVAAIDQPRPDADDDGA